MREYIVFYRKYSDAEFWEEMEIKVPDNQDPNEYAARKLYYGGDENGKPEDYISDLEIPDQAFFIPLNKTVEVDFTKIDKAHKEWHKKNREAQIEAKELKELERLKRKYMGR